MIKKLLYSSLLLLFIQVASQNIHIGDYWNKRPPINRNRVTTINYTGMPPKDVSTIVDLLSDPDVKYSGTPTFAYDYMFLQPSLYKRNEKHPIIYMIDLST